jgi:hypothetical protein
MNYASLTLQIQQYANRTDAFFVSVIPDFITQAINTIYCEAKSIGFETVLTSANGLIVINQNLIAKPQGWKETISFQYTIPAAPPAPPFSSFLLPRTYEFCINYWPNTTATGLPKFYANYGNSPGNDNFFIAPTPNATYPAQLIYLGLPTFDAMNTTNFLTLRYPSLLLYRCVLEAVIFLKDDERIAKFEDLYNKQLQDILKETTDRYTDRTSKRDKD